MGEVGKAYIHSTVPFVLTAFALRNCRYTISVKPLSLSSTSSLTIRFEPPYHQLNQSETVNSLTSSIAGWCGISNVEVVFPHSRSAFVPPPSPTTAPPESSAAAGPPASSFTPSPPKAQWPTSLGTAASAATHSAAAVRASAACARRGMPPR